MAKKGRLKKVVLALFVLTGLASLATTYFLVYESEGNLDTWIAKQLLSFVQPKINPVIAFDSVDYIPPKQFVVKGLTFTSDSKQILNVAKLEMTLHQIPSRGESIVVERITATQPNLSFYYDNETKQLAGYSDFVKKSSNDTAVIVKDAVDGGHNKDAEDKSISQSKAEQPETTDPFRINHIDIIDGHILYQQGNDTAQAMTLADININIDVSATNASKKHTHHIQATLEKQPVVTTTLDAILDSRSSHLAIQKLSMDVDLLDEMGKKSLPPQVQQILDDLSAKGRLKIDLRGDVQLQQPESVKIDANLQLSDFLVKQGDYQIPIRDLQGRVHLKNQHLTIADLSMKIFSGELVVSKGQLDLNKQSIPATLSWQARNIPMENILLAKTKQGESEYAGKVFSNGYVNLSLSRKPSIQSGKGTLQIKEGRLVTVPVLRELNQVLNIANRLTGASARADSLATNFHLAEDKVTLNRLALENHLIAVNAKGDVFYTGALDLTAQAGPLEKVGNMLGPLGQLLNTVTEKLLQYEISGTVDDPKIRPRVMGIKPIN